MLTGRGPSLDLDKHFGGRIPWHVKTCFLGFICVLLMEVGFLLTIRRWGELGSNCADVSLIRTGGEEYCVDPRVGWFIHNGIWIGVGLLALIFLFAWLHNPNIRANYTADEDDET